jgi:benzoate membrane transport protein
MPDPAVSAPARASFVQPAFAGVLAAVVGFASSFAVVLAGLDAAGATPAQAASGLFVLTIVMGLVGIWLSLKFKMPISVAWTTPGAALLVATGPVEGGFGAAVGAFIVCGVLIVTAGLWRPFGRAVAAIPSPLASAMLAGVLLELCLAPVRAVSEMPALALPIIAAWLITLKFARLYAVPVAVLVTAIIIAVFTPLPEGALRDIVPAPVWIMPTLTLDAVVGIALPLFIVTMASQNIPGLAVLRTNGYSPEIGPLFVSTGAASALVAPFGGMTINLAAITAALCAGPEAHPDPGRRYLASLVAGVTYLVLGLGAAFAAAFIVASPPLLIQAVAGLALMGALAAALQSAMTEEKDRLAAVVTFVTVSSGITVFGIGAAFWGLIAGGAVMALLRARP